MNTYKKGFLIVLIVGVFFVLIGIFLLASSFIQQNFGYFFGGFVGIVVGGMMLWHSFPAFIPNKSQITARESCPFCGALVSEDTGVCEKCKQQLD